MLGASPRSLIFRSGTCIVHDLPVVCAPAAELPEARTPAIPRSFIEIGAIFVSLKRADTVFGRGRTRGQE